MKKQALGHVEKTTNGIMFTESIISSQGASFILFPEKEHTKSEIEAAKREIHRDRDVVSLRIADEGDRDDIYKSQYFSDPRVRPLKWYQIEQDENLIRRERKKGTTPTEFVDKFVFPFIKETEKKYRSKYGDKIEGVPQSYSVLSTIYKKLLKVIPGLDKKLSSIQDGDVEFTAKSKSGSFMDLNFEYRKNEGNNRHIISLAHYYVQEGDLMSDPFMEIRVIPDLQVAEALYFEMSHPPVSRYVYPDPNHVNMREKKDQNHFLNQWLTNLIHQGHRIDLNKKVNEDIGALPVGLKGKIYGLPYKVLIQYEINNKVSAEIYEDTPKGELIVSISGNTKFLPAEIQKLRNAVIAQQYKQVAGLNGYANIAAPGHSYKGYEVEIVGWNWNDGTTTYKYDIFKNGKGVLTLKGFPFKTFEETWAEADKEIDHMIAHKENLGDTQEKMDKDRDKTIEKFVKNLSQEVRDYNTGKTKMPKKHSVSPGAKKALKKAREVSSMRKEPKKKIPTHTIQWGKDFMKADYDLSKLEYFLDLEEDAEKSEGLTPAIKYRKSLILNAIKKKKASEKKPKKKQHSQITSIERIDEEHRIIRRFVALHGKTKTHDQVMNFLDYVQKAILERRVKKNSPFAKEVMHIQNELVKIYNQMINKKLPELKLSLSEKELKEYGAIAQSQFEMPSIQLLKRYISWDGKRITKEKAIALRDQLTNAVKKGKINKQDAYASEANRAYENLTEYIKNYKRGNALKIYEAELRGVNDMLVKARDAAKNIANKAAPHLKRATDASTKFVKEKVIPVAKKGAKKIQEKIQAKAHKEKEQPEESFAEKIIGDNFEIWDELKIRSGSQLDKDKKLKKQYEQAVNEKIVKVYPKSEFTKEVFETLEFENEHTLIKTLLKNKSFSKSLGNGILVAIATGAAAGATNAFVKNQLDKKGVGGVVSSESVKDTLVQTIGLGGKWKTLFGDPSNGFSVLIYGAPKGGKSTMSLIFAKHLAENHGPTLYVTAEEGVTSPSFIKKIKDHNIQHPRLFMADTLPADLIPYEFIFIDSLNKLDIGEDEISALKKQYPQKNFFFIAQSRKDGNYKGNEAIKHEVDTVVEVKSGMAKGYGRFNPEGEITIFKKPVEELELAQKV